MRAFAAAPAGKPDNILFYQPRRYPNERPLLASIANTCIVVDGIEAVDNVCGFRGAHTDESEALARRVMFGAFSE